MDARDMIRHFVESMTQLMAVMQREIDLVKQKSFHEIEKLQRHKSQLSKAYETHQARLHQDISVLGALDADERSELRELYARFRETLSENMLALKATQDATDRVIKMIIGGVKKARGITASAPSPIGRSPSGYAAYAQTGGGGGVVGLDRTF
ncbi:MAG: hypothetical protein HQ481_19910 [Alphaproteobacteria bacterium]|nr:hypothetical protein [Alphaproteobacteria bacterium]